MTQLRHDTSRGRLLVGGLVLLASCTSFDPRRVADAKIQVVNRHAQCVKIKSTTGVDQERHFIGELAPPLDLYDKSLRLAVQRSQVFSGICKPGQAGLDLDVVMFEGPHWTSEGSGISHTVPVNWRLTDPATRRVLYQERIDGKGTNNRGVAGMTQLSSSIEMAFQASIVQGLEHISKLDLSSGK
jgi:hypothetical protein